VRRHIRSSLLGATVAVVLTGTFADASGGGLVPQVQVQTPVVTVTTPTVPAPSISGARVTVPSVTAPSVTVPSVSTPSVTTPSVSTPSVTTPSVQAPSVQTPSVPSPSGGGGSAGGGAAGGGASGGGASGGSQGGGAGSGGSPGAGASAPQPAGGPAPSSAGATATDGADAAGARRVGADRERRAGRVTAHKPPARDTADARLHRLVLDARACMDQLGARERRVLGLRAGLGPRPALSRGQVASRLGLGVAQTGRIERSGLRRLGALEGAGACAGASGSRTIGAAGGLLPTAASAAALATTPRSAIGGVSASGRGDGARSEHNGGSGGLGDALPPPLGQGSDWTLLILLTLLALVGLLVGREVRRR
jgi:hypothetical protein